MLAWNLTGWVRFLLFFVPWCGLPFTTKTFLLNWLLCRDSFSSWIIDRVCDFPSWNCLNQSKKHACLSQITFIGSLQIGKADNKSILLHIQTGLKDLKECIENCWSPRVSFGHWPSFNAGNLQHGFDANFTVRVFNSKTVGECRGSNVSEFSQVLPALVSPPCPLIRAMKFAFAQAPDTSR